MKFILCFFLFVGVLGTPKHTELNVEDFFAKFDTEVTLQEARKFDFSNKKNFALGIYPTCDRFRLSKQSCPAMQAMEWWHSSFHRSDEMKMYSDVMINCECQTVWCIHDIFTIYEKNGKLYKGNVTVKTPCKCDCRKKFEGWIGKK
ncbi:uncharacterized protein LOC144432358 isoform X2 [Styela clava]